MKINYDVSHGRRRRFLNFIISKRNISVFIISMAVLFGGLYGAFLIEANPLSSNSTEQLFMVKTGDTISTIANNLQKQQLIKSSLALKVYAYRSQLQAGTYSLSPNLSTQEIVKRITKGKVATKLVTILPGMRLDQIRAGLIDSGFSPASVDQALSVEQYNDLPIMSYLPAGITSLEGLLWPDSYQVSLGSDASSVVRAALMETNLQLTDSLKSAFENEGLTVYKGLILSSIIVKEVSKPSDQAQAAQVFLSRLKLGMQLGSDVTALYGSITSGQGSTLTYNSPYNTLIHTGLPPTPISNVTVSALAAATHPATTNWLYFVAGDNGTTYFSTNLKDHQTLTAQYCHLLCQ